MLWAVTKCWVSMSIVIHVNQNCWLSPQKKSDCLVAPHCRLCGIYHVLLWDPRWPDGQSDGSDCTASHLCIPVFGRFMCNHYNTAICRITLSSQPVACFFICWLLWSLFSGLLLTVHLSPSSVLVLGHWSGAAFMFSNIEGHVTSHNRPFGGKQIYCVPRTW